MQGIVPHLWFGHQNCEEAVHYYVSVFPNSGIDSIRYYPDASLDPHFEGMAGKVLTVQFHLDGHPFQALDGPPLFAFSEAISLVIHCRDQQEIDYYTEKLSHVPESAQCGWVKDRFGLSWQIIPDHMEELTRSDAQMQAMMQMKKIDIRALEEAGKK